MQPKLLYNQTLGYVCETNQINYKVLSYLLISPRNNIVYWIPLFIYKKINCCVNCVNMSPKALPVTATLAEYISGIVFTSGVIVFPFTIIVKKNEIF